MVKCSGDLDRVLQALADPTRRAIVERLIAGPASVSHLAEPFSMSLPAVLQHIGLLEEAGLVRTQKVGRVRTCQVEPDSLRAAEAWFVAQRTSWERRLDQLEDELARSNRDEPTSRRDRR